MDLFAKVGETVRRERASLATRMRPQSLAEVVGQKHLIGEGKLLRRVILADQLGSMIFHGPPGTGKTTLAYVIARTTKAHFVKLNAVTSGVNDLRQVIEEAREQLKYYQQSTILFIDEIHRFNKVQQDALLPAVEEGQLILIGATTENPYFSVISALLSRSRLFKLEFLNESEIKELLQRALQDQTKGLGNYRLEVSPEALQHFIEAARGDARQALNGLELAVLSTLPNQAGLRQIDLAVAEESFQEKAVLYDQTGDQHYDVISAFIKSIRGSEPDAALHYLARMLQAGEDPLFIARRLVIQAAEDIGLADPLALLVAEAAARGLERVGLPEGKLLLAEATLYLARAPKSNSVLALLEAWQDLEKGKYGMVPLHLRAGSKEKGKGYLPAELQGVQYYQPSGKGQEKDEG